MVVQIHLGALREQKRHFESEWRVRASVANPGWPPDGESSSWPIAAVKDVRPGQKLKPGVEGAGNPIRNRKLFGVGDDGERRPLEPVGGTLKHENEIMLLEPHERERFCQYLRQQIESGRLMLEQFERLPYGRTLAEREKARIAAWMVVLTDLERI